MAEALNLRINTGRSEVYYPHLRPIIVQSTVDITVTIDIDPETQEVIIKIDHVAGPDSGITQYAILA